MWPLHIFSERRNVQVWKEALMKIDMMSLCPLCLLWDLWHWMPSVPCVWTWDESLPWKTQREKDVCFNLVFSLFVVDVFVVVVVMVVFVFVEMRGRQSFQLSCVPGKCCLSWEGCLIELNLPLQCTTASGQSSYHPNQDAQASLASTGQSIRRDTFGFPF